MYKLRTQKKNKSDEKYKENEDEQKFLKIGKIIKSNSFPIKANEIRKFLINSYF